MPAVEIYTTRYCPYCRWAKELLTRKGVSFSEIAVDGDRALRTKMTERANGRTSVPQIFVGLAHVGGFDELHALEEEGKLNSLLAAQGQPA